MNVTLGAAGEALMLAFFKQQKTRHGGHHFVGYIVAAFQVLTDGGKAVFRSEGYAPPAEEQGATGVRGAAEGGVFTGPEEIHS